MTETKYRCYMCGREYESGEIRFSGVQNKLACVYCLGVKAREIPSTAVEKKPKPKEEYQEYRCSSCKYEFKRKKSVPVTTCPYCSKEDCLVLKKTTSANELLKDSTDRRFES